MSQWIRNTTRERIYRRDGHTCVYCGATAADALLTLDHVMPRALGGNNATTNLVTACIHCNSARKTAPVAEFARYIADNGIDPKTIANRVRNAQRRQLPR